MTVAAPIAHIAHAVPAVLAVLSLLVAACTPRAGAPTADARPINGITESIEEPIVDVDPQFVDPRTVDRDAVTGFSGSEPVNVGAFRTTAAQEARIDSLIGVMTLAEKAGQMNQYTSFYDVTGPAPDAGKAAERYAQIGAGLVGSMLNVTGAAETRKLQELALGSRLGIPLVFAFDVIHGFRTQFPVPLAEAATFDLELIEGAARWAATEASAHGIHWTFAPMVDVSPDARWGRIVEGAGEDPYYGSLVAAARVRGFQGDRLSDETSVAACAKHFAGYGYSGAGRDYNAVDVSDYTLHNDILPPFRAAAAAGSATFMNGFNTLGGVPVTGDRDLQRGWLKGGLAWPGFVVSDWNSIGEMVAHGAVADRAAAAERAVEAGSDMDMETTAFVNHLPELVRAGEVDEALLDDAVRRILRVKMALGLFDDPFKNCDPARAAAVAGDPAMRAAAIETAAASAVLLKNEPAGAAGATAPLLPLDPAGAGRILVVGDLATDDDSPQGTWSLAAERGGAVTLVDALREQLTDPARLSVAAGPPTLRPDSKRDFLFEVLPNTTDRSGLDAAVAAARRADVVVMALGEPGFMSGEARSRTDIGLPGLQQELFDAVHAVNPRVAVVLYSGRPLDLTGIAERAPALLLAWQPGTYGQHGIAEVLVGKRGARGKLPVSFPYAVGQEPLTYREYATGRPGPAEQPTESSIVFNSHYMDAPRGARYPFGHGLTYTTWKIGEPSVVEGVPGAGTQVTIVAEVTNTGTRAGTQVVQLYLRDPVAARVRPVRELKGIQTVTLGAGESATVRFPITRELLRYWTPERGWHVEPGSIEAFVGTSSQELSAPVEFAVGEDFEGTR